MRCAQRLLHVAPRTYAGIDESAGAKFFQRFDVKLPALALRVRREGPADVGAFLPAEAEPAQVFKHRGDELGFAPVAVEILVANDQRAAPGLSALLRGPERPGVAEVQESSGRGSDASAIVCHHLKTVPPDYPAAIR